MTKTLIFLGPTNSGKTSTSKSFIYSKLQIFNFDTYYREIRKTKSSKTFLNTIVNTNTYILEKIKHSDQEIVIYEGAHLILPSLFNEIINTIDKNTSIIVLYNFPFTDLIERMKSRFSYSKSRSEKIILLIFSFSIFKIYFKRTINSLKLKGYSVVEIKDSNLEICDIVALIKTQIST